MKLLVEMTADAVQENPSIAGGICIFAVAFTLVTANALYGQQGGHPGPIWATRDKITTQSLPAKSAPERRSATIAPNTLTMDYVPVPVMRPNAATTLEVEPASNIVLDVQRDLAELELYEGELDGVYGPRTKQAILQFERDFGYAPSGEANAVLAERIALARQNRSTEIVDRISEALPAEPVGAVELVSADQSLRDSAMIARIQIGLINFGENQISIDGVLGADTQAAIRRFEKRYGLPETGQASARIIEKMEAIGVLQKG